MKLIVDTNVLFTYFWEKAITKKLIMLEDLELFAPEFSLEELNKYEQEIIKKTGISESKFSELKFDLAISVKFIPMEEYNDFLKEALEISPDQNDIDFFALALKLRLPIWSNDPLLKSQDKIKILNTEEVLNLI